MLGHFKISDVLWPKSCKQNLKLKITTLTCVYTYGNDGSARGLRCAKGFRVRGAFVKQQAREGTRTALGLLDSTS